MSPDDAAIQRRMIEARAAFAIRRAPSQIVTRAGTMLRMVRLGLRDMAGPDPDRILLGFLAVVVFGRSMTLVMQNLRTHDQATFDTWYAPWLAEMRSDALLLYFSKLRTRIVHESAPAIAIVLAAQGESTPAVGSLTVDGAPPPSRHLGQRLEGASTGDVCRLYVAYLERIFDSFAPVAFAVQDQRDRTANENDLTT